MGEEKDPQDYWCMTYSFTGGYPVNVTAVKVCQNWHNQTGKVKPNVAINTFRSYFCVWRSTVQRWSLWTRWLGSIPERPRIDCLVHLARKEGNVLFNDALNTFYLRLYGVIHTVKDDLDSERGNPLPPLNGLLFSIRSGQVRSECLTCTFRASCCSTRSSIHDRNFSISSKWVFYMHHPRDRIAPVVEHWLEREIAQWVHHEGSIWRPIGPLANAVTTHLAR